MSNLDSRLSLSHNWSGALKVFSQPGAGNLKINSSLNVSVCVVLSLP